MATSARRKDDLAAFDVALSVSAEEIEFELRPRPVVPWADFLLNPRLLRGSDFLMRWSQGQWSEHRITEAVNESKRFFALPYGPSGTAPDEDPREFELYFERLERAGLGAIKRPDLLILPASEQKATLQMVSDLGGLRELPFVPEDDEKVRDILSRAIIAVECENSLWKASMMPDFGAELKPMRRLGGKPGLILPTVQTYQAPGGPTTKKTIFKIYYQYAYAVGRTKEEPALIAAHLVDKNGHILPYVKFQGGSFALEPEAVEILNNAVKK